MPNSEFLTWQAYDIEDPIGTRGDDQRFDALMKLIFSANSEKGTKLPNFFQRWQQPKVETITDKAKGFFKAYMDNPRKKKRRKRDADEAPDQATPLNNENTESGV